MNEPLAYRLREASDTIERCNQHFWRSGHRVEMRVFDDSSPLNQEKYFPLLGHTRTHNDRFYVGSRNCA